MLSLLARCATDAHARRMFTVTESQAAAIRAAFEHGGEFSAAVELRRLFPAVTDSTEARAQARIIAGWAPVPLIQPRPVTWLRAGRSR
jgi:hypothetical protein